MKAILKSSSGIVFGIASAISSLVLASCSNHTAPGLNLTGNYSAIMSTRPQTATDTIAVVKLHEKPLLTAMQVINGKKQIDPDQVKAVLAEQADVIAKLNAISPKIEVLYRYRLVANGLAIVTPLDLLPQIREITNVAYVETQTSFARPEVQTTSISFSGPALTNSSVKFIGASDAQARGIRGQGMKIGIIDTGIDYTHAMFGGAGTPDAYKAVDPSKDSGLFPSAKVVGGIDLVGTEYDSDSADYSKRTPHMDHNPLDEAGHGSHVAGTVAGHGDGVNTYDGVAPDASLYAIKVFGKDGSTGDAVVVAGLEYAANPKGDLDLSDALDVVNLSLGSSYGSGHILYTEAMQNLSRAGTVVVASAGNSGDNDYIVGAPSVADDAISVAASVDDMDQNWKFRAVRFTTVDEPALLIEAIEGTITKSLKDISDVTGPLVAIGLADQDLSADVKLKLKGNVALIDRGVVPFSQKIARAVDAGAIGVVVANNQSGEPIAMGGDGQFDIPAIMVTKALGEKLKLEMLKGPVTIAFKTEGRIEKPQLIDTITGFSSKGPRSNDALLKPEISAPGSLVISAKMGGGAEAVQMSGTSMASPHMTGVMALLKQSHPNLSSAELKSLAMSTAKTLNDADGVVYPLSRQGAGRIQVLRAIDQQVVSEPAALSLGEVTIESRKMIRQSVTLKNTASSSVSYDVVFSGGKGLSLRNAPRTVTLSGLESKTLTLDFIIDASSLAQSSTELDGLLTLNVGGVESLRIPVIAIADKISQIQADSLVIHSTSLLDSQGAAVDVNLKNVGVNPGDAYLFNLIGEDGRKEDKFHDPYMERGCDMQSAGYRVIEKNGVPTIQFAVKIYEPLSTWDNCEVSVLIDADGDGIPEQELVGAKQDHLKGLSKTTFASLLLDASAARGMRKQFELDTLAHKKDVTENYTDAVVAISEMLSPVYSTVAIVEAPVSALKVRLTGELSVRILTSYQELSAVTPDDVLEKNAKTWTAISVAPGAQAFTGLPEKLSLNPGDQMTVQITKGAGFEKLLVLAPQNAPVVGGLRFDQQSMILDPIFDLSLLAAGH